MGSVLRSPMSKLALVLLAFVWLIQLQGIALAQATEPEPTAPKLVATQTTVRLDVKKDALSDTEGTPGAARGTLLLSNQGTEPATGIGITGYSNNGASFALETSVDGVPLSDIPPNETTRIRLTFNWRPEDSDAGWLVVTDSARKSPSLVIPFQIRELVPGTVFTSVTVASAIVAVLLCLATFLSFVWFKLPKENRGPKLSRVVHPAASWTFNGSWASNLTTAGAVLGTILGASGFLTEVLPGLATGLFVGISLGFLLLSLLAPIVYTATHNEDGEPTYLALLLGSGVTLWAVVGELGILALLVTRGGFPPLWIWVGGISVLILIFLYVRASIKQVLLAKPPKPSIVRVLLGEPPQERAAEDRQPTAEAAPVEVPVTLAGPSAML